MALVKSNGAFQRPLSVTPARKVDAERTLVVRCGISSTRRRRPPGTYDRYVRQAVAEPYILGYQRCQYEDRYDPLRTLLKQGLVNRQGRPYDILTEQIGRTNEDVLKQAYRATD